ncbi:MAG: ABC-2 transporter permease [Actinomycetales bacterium]|nr:ABC-2 transporter permease [Actinomycetales bacterium]
MNAVLRMAVLDVRTVRPYRTQMVILFALTPMLALLWHQATMAPVMLMVMSVFVAAYPFAIAEKSDLDTLYGVLPVRQVSVVLGRYAFAFGLGLVAALVGSGVGLALAAAMGEPFEPAELGYLLVAATTIVGLMIALQFPLYFAFGYARARLATFLPMFAVMGATVVAMDVLPERSITLPAPGVLVVVALVLTAALTAASAALSVRLDARRVR